ncbi:sugar transferase [bacterium]|nr:sugar transferase [bacterium]MBU1065595.1 sugar transferase [bacterium]MBU1632887.1 sugar transferase [bacterium]MBU1873247.1 sugar transferase [bacterium]
MSFENIYNNFSIFISILGIFITILLYTNLLLKMARINITDFELGKRKSISQSNFYFISKRTFDLLFSLIILIASAPIIIIIIILHKIFIRGSLFNKTFITDKLSNKSFYLYTFKTLITINSENNTQHVLSKFGKYLRMYSLDEIPKFFNVLIGDISLVGRDYYHEDKIIKNFLNENQISLLRNIPIGLITLWRISPPEKRQNIDSDRIKFDYYYASNASYFGDINLIFRILIVYLGTSSSK